MSYRVEVFVEVSDEATDEKDARRIVNALLLVDRRIERTIYVATSKIERGGG